MTYKLPYKIPSENREYSGWTNYETWVVRLHMDNDVKGYEKHMEAAVAALREHEGDRHAATIEFRETLERQLEDKAPFYRNDVYADLLRGALGNVNWWELATSWMEDVEITEEAPESEEKETKPRMQAVASRSKYTLTATPEVLALLTRSTIDEEGLTLPGEQLPRDQYETVNKFLDLAGAKWNKGKKRHVFKAGAKAKIDALLASGQIEDEQKKLQAYYTPESVAKELAAIAGITPGLYCFEPSAGGGAIASAIKEAGGDVFCIDISPEAVGNLEERGFDADRADLLELEPNAIYDRVLMNPPFTNDQDIRHVERAYQWLKPGGKLYAIMSPGFTYGISKVRTGFREFVASHGRVVKELSQDTFKESGANVKTVIVELVKPLSEEPRDLFSFVAA